MKLYEAQNIIKDVFENKFDKEKYAYFIRNLLKNLQISEFTRAGYNIPKAFTGFISLYERIGKYEDEEGNEIDVLIVKLNKAHSIDYARSKQRSFVRWYLNKKMREAALVAFHSDKSPDWRFSFIKMQYSLEKKKDELTPAKRFSFLVGEKGKSHTAQRQLINILKNDYAPTLADIEEAFNIEAVSDEFYKKYHNLLFDLVEAIEKIIKKDKVVKEEFGKQKIEVLDFSKKLLGQIVFLYFLQRKGWLGLDEGAKYGDGDKNFLRNLFNQVKPKENFFNDYLEFLFYDALSGKRVTDYYKKFDTRIPFLNGGLFDPINFYDWEKTDIIIPNKLFSDRENDEEGNGILDVFDLYNFTVKEDEPLEKEVAIDPEMLGKVFERMLEVKERKSKGAFYTPREIVHYMAQQSLLYYLENSPLSEGWQTQSDGVLASSASVSNSGTNTEKNQTQPNNALNSASPMEGKNNEQIKSGIYKKYKQLPYNPKLKERAKELRKAGILSEVIFWNAVKNKQFLGADFHRQKIIGNYIVDFYAPEFDLVVEIDGSSHDAKVEYDAKRDEYMKSLGLNVIRFADRRIKNDLNNVLTELERYCLGIKHSSGEVKHPASALRQSHPSNRGEWIKDLEKFIHYGEHIIDKDIAIEEGLYSANSNKYEVPESIRTNAEAIDKALENIKICDPAVGSGAFPVGVMNEIVKLRNLLTPFIKNKTNRDSYHFKANAIQNSIYGVDIDAGAVEIAKLRLWLSMVVDENRIDNIEPLPNLEYKIVRGNSLINMPEGSFRDAKLESEIEQLTNRYYKITDKEEKQKQKEIIDNKIQKLLKSASEFAGYEIDFDFKLFFHEVFEEKNGFDVVIGNPPYITISKTPEKETLLKIGFETFVATGDLYTLFYEKGNRLLKTDGSLCFITSNKWLNSSYGSKTRKYIAQKTNPIILFDFAKVKIFPNATVFVNILLLKNALSQNELKAVTIKGTQIPINSLESYFRINSIKLKDLSNEIWKISTREGVLINDKIEKAGIPLRSWKNLEFFRGITTGLNQAFLISRVTAEKLIKKQKNSKEIIYSLLRGKDIKRWTYFYNNIYIIFTKQGIDISKYSAIQDYLRGYYTDLLPKKTRKEKKGRKPGSYQWFEIQDNTAYYEYFLKPKIIWIEISDRANYAFDDAGYFLTNSAYFISGDNLKYLVGLLNSSVADYYFFQITAKIAGGRKRYTKQYVEQIPIPKISEKKQALFELLVDYILFLKQQKTDTQSFYFEQIIDGMVYELYFEKEIKKAGRDIIKYLQDLPEITDEMSDNKKQKIITEVYNKLYDKNSPVRNNLFYMKSIEEIKIIEESLNR